MKKNILLLATIAALASCLPVATNAATQVYDLKTDWSDTQNPNGRWSYLSAGDGHLLSNYPSPTPFARFIFDESGALTQRRCAEDCAPNPQKTFYSLARFFPKSRL